MASESAGSSRISSEAPSEPATEILESDSSVQKDNESIITDLPALHTAKRLKIEARKLDGMQRELYSLIGENTPPVVVTPESKFRTKPEWQQKAAAWKIAEFSPKEGLTLHHWVRAASVADGSGGDRFARFNTPVEVPEWSDSDYSLFSSEDWSLEETRHLFDLAKDYDLRWLVIADRFNSETKRSVEDLKERYYNVCSALIKSKGKTSDLGLSPYEEELLKAMKFDKATELKRKAHLERLLSRSPKEVAEEEALILESRRLEGMADKILAERKELLGLLESPAPINSKTTKADLSTSQGIGQLLQELQNEKSRRGSTPANGASTSTQSVTADSRQIVNSLVSKTLGRKPTNSDLSAIGILFTDSSSPKHSGVYLRSAKLTPVRQNLLPKVRAVLSELELPIKPVMPTARTCRKYEQMYQLITLLLEAKKVQDKLEMEVEVLKRAKESQKPQEESNASG